MRRRDPSCASSEFSIDRAQRARRKGDAAHGRRRMRALQREPIVTAPPKANGMADHPIDRRLIGRIPEAKKVDDA
jgi:hypothetical protein